MPLNALSMEAPEREVAKHHQFKIQMFDFCGKNLPSFDKVELFLKIDFGGFKVFKTEQALNTTMPEWAFKAGFLYSMQYLEKLKTRELKIQCFNRRADHLVGEAMIDLHTVACGPTHFKLTLKAPVTGEDCGKIKFSCLMKMISPDFTVILRDVKLTMLGITSAARIDVNTTSDEQQRMKMAHSADGSWQGPFKIVIGTSLGDLLKVPNHARLRFDVIDYDGMKQGEAHLAFRNVFCTQAEALNPFNIDVIYTYSTQSEEGSENIGRIGELEGHISYQNIPEYAQMVGGLCHDGQIEGGHWLIKGLPYPSTMSQSPPLCQDPAERAGLESLFADHEQNEENEISFQDVNDETFYAALEQIDVPPPWEKRRERVNDRLGCRMYFIDPRSRRTTYKDPRFMPENWDQRIDPSTGKVYFHYHRNKGFTCIDPRGCPKDWEMRLSKENEPYFAYLPARKTTWSDPRGLPETFEMCLDDYARLYFKDHDKKSTTWVDPRQDRPEVLLTQWRQAQMTRWLREQVRLELDRLYAEEAEEEEVGDDGDGKSSATSSRKSSC